MTVKELLNKIDSRELTEWQAFFILEKEERDAHQQTNATLAKVKKGRR